MLRDRIVNALTGRNMETVPMTLEQIVELLKKAYISKAETDEDYDMILKTVKGALFGEKTLISKDGKYEISCVTGRRVGIFNLKDHNRIWIQDIEADKYYEYSAYSFRKFKKAVREAIASAKANI